MITVAVESPFKANERFTQEEHVMYARLALLDSLIRGEAPFASHLLYTQVWNDAVVDLRQRGIAAGLALSAKLDMSAFYIDIGWSDGMRLGFDVVKTSGRSFEVRQILTIEQHNGLILGELKMVDIYNERVRGS